MTPTAVNQQVARSGSLLDRLRARPLNPLLVNWILIVTIVGADWITPAGVGVGILLIVPILLSAMRDDRPAIVGLTVFIAATGFALAAIFGVEAQIPASIWLSNRVMVVLGLVVTTAVAFLVQRTRVQVLQGRDSALAEKDLNRLLMSLLAHDLRSPLTVASQGFKYVEEALTEGRPIDKLLLSDVRARLRRSLRAIEIVLSLARSELPREGAAPAAKSQQPVRIDNELRAEVESFEDEAFSRGKELRMDLARVESQTALVDGLVLRQVVAILLDNAVRHALPGPVKISADLASSKLDVWVEDSGPGLSTHRARGATATSGMGMGLELCRTLVVRAGGTLEIGRDGPQGTCFQLQLPAQALRQEEKGGAEPSTTSRSARPSALSH